MIKFEHTKVMNLEAAIRGMRNPMNSWKKSDSYATFIEDAETLETAEYQYFVGEEDLKLMKSLVKAGSDHRKFMRQIFVSVDITAPRYWWTEADTYKVGTVRNSCSTMHKIHEKEFTLNDFSIEHIDLLKIENVGYYPFNHMIEDIIKVLNYARAEYIKTNDKKYWWQMIQLLPQSYNQKATVTMNYENIFNMYHARKNHKLDEWRIGFVEWAEQLPYFMELVGNEEK